MKRSFIPVSSIVLALLMVLTSSTISASGKTTLPMSDTIPIASRVYLPAMGTDYGSDGNNRVIWVGKSSIDLYSLQTHISSTLVSARSSGEGFGPVIIRGDWLIYLDDPESIWTGLHWILKARNLKSGKVIIISRADPTLQHASGLIPQLSASGHLVAWTRWMQRGGTLQSVLSIYNLDTHTTSVVSSAETPNSIGEASIFEQHIAWTRVHVTPHAASSPVVSSTLWLRSLDAHTTKRLHTSQSASEVSLWGDFLAYKGSALRTGSGDIYLYRLSTGHTTRLTNAGAENSIDAPSVGAFVVTWSNLRSGAVGIYDLASHTTSVIPSAGRSETVGRILTYLAEINTRDPEAGFHLVVDRVQ